MYLFAGEVARAAAEAGGMRAWVGRCSTTSLAELRPLEKGFVCTRELIDRYRDHPLITATVDPHAVYTCAPACSAAWAGPGDRLAPA